MKSDSHSGLIRKTRRTQIFEQFMLKAEEYQDHIIYHYGSYEATFLKRKRLEATSQEAN